MGAIAGLFLPSCTEGQDFHPRCRRYQQRGVPQPSFGFSYKLPYGWVDRTADLQDDSPQAAGARVLLAVFERPPRGRGRHHKFRGRDCGRAALSGFKTPVEYFESLATLTTAQGFQASQDLRRFLGRPRSWCAGDFSKARGTLTMRQTSLVRVEKGYAVSFTFVAGSEDEVNQLIENLSLPRASADPPVILSGVEIAARTFHAVGGPLQLPCSGSGGICSE